MYDIVIIGAGCAGLTAAMYAARADKKVVVLEKENVGGQITAAYKVENYPGIPQISGLEFSNQLYEQAAGYGAEIELADVVGVEDCEDYKKVTTDDGEYETKTIIISTGVKHRKLGIEDEEKFTGHGVSYCAVCDGAFFKKQVVAVAGGGNTAIGDALFLSQYCKDVYVIHRRDKFRAEKRLVDNAMKKDNIHFIMNSEITGLVGENVLSEINIKNNMTGEIKSMAASGLFVAVGQVPANEIFSELNILDENGYIDADENGVTSVKGIYAGGDCRNKRLRQLATAASDGANCAQSAIEYISK